MTEDAVMSGPREHPAGGWMEPFTIRRIETGPANEVTIGTKPRAGMTTWHRLIPEPPQFWTLRELPAGPSMYGETFLRVTDTVQTQVFASWVTERMEIATDKPEVRLYGRWHLYTAYVWKEGQ